MDQLFAEVQLDGAVSRLLGVGPSAESVFFVINDDERVLGTGLNDRGQLGTGDKVNKSIPTAVKFQERVIIDVMSASGDHTLALGLVSGTFRPTEPPSVSPTVGQTPSPTRTSQGLFLWGAPEAVGEADIDDLTQPVFVDEDAVYTAAGSRYSLIVLSNGNALSAGYIESLDDYRGHLGLSKQDVVQGVNQFSPISQVYDAEALAFTSPLFDKVFAGVENTPDSGAIHSILLDRQGRAWATGSNEKGQLCLGDNDDRMIPEKIPSLGRIVDVALGGEHTLLLDEFGNIYGCGSNAVGQLGLGEGLIDTASPTMVDGLGLVTSISAGHSHSLFTARDGIYFTGSNEFGQLCADTGGDNISTPRALNIDQRVAVSFEAIKESSFILYEDGSVNGCGRNNFGQLGDGTNQDQFTVESVELDGRVVRLLGVGPSAQSVFFVTNDEHVWGTGLNNRGQLGVGDKENRNLPTRVKFKKEVLLVSISAGADHTLALGVITGASPSPTYAPTTVVPPPTPSPTYIDTPSPTYIVLVDNPTRFPTGYPTTTINPTMSGLTYTPTYNPTPFGGAYPCIISTPCHGLLSSSWHFFLLE